MKYLKVWMLALLVTGFVSCSKKDDSSSSTGGILGNWSVTTISYTGTSTVNYSGIAQSASFTGVGTYMDLRIQFQEDPNLYTANGDYSILLKTTIEGTDFEQEYPMTGFIGSGSWEKRAMNYW